MTTYFTPNDVNDQAKYDALVTDFATVGWQGEPLVKWGESDLITGSHRYAAAKAAGLDNDDIPMIDLEEVFAEAGLDFDALHAEYDHPTYSEIWFSGLLDELPAAIIEKYGIQF